MENPELQGVFGIVPTPFDRSGNIDTDGLAHLVGHCAESGLHAAVVLGSNGEFPYLTTDEKLELIKAAAEAGKDKVDVIAGVSAVSTREAVLYAETARESGCHAVMAALPLYWQVDLDRVKEHFSILARDGGLPVIFYYFPEVTGLVLGPDEIAEIAEISGVHGVKITVMNRSFLKRVIRNTRTRLWAVFAGSSFMMRYTLKNEGAGVICPLPLIAPRDCMDLYDAMMKHGDMEKAQQLQDKLLGAIPIMTGMDFPQSVSAPYWKAVTAKPYIGPPERPQSTVMMVKEALRLQGHPITSVVRGPVPRLTKEQSDLVKRTLESQGWL